MVRECFKTQTGIMFNSEGLRIIGLDPATLYPYVQKRPSPLPVAGAQIQHIPPPKSKASHFAEVNDLVNIHKTEEEHELMDALAPVYDQLSLAWSWWILELMPTKHRYQRGDNTWQTYLTCNFGRGRFIPKQKQNVIKVHRSVKMRMEAQYPGGGRYLPKASFQRALENGNVEWVD